jgi:hypothetical protein
VAERERAARLEQLWRDNSATPLFTRPRHCFGDEPHSRRYAARSYALVARI